MHSNTPTVTVIVDRYDCKCPSLEGLSVADQNHIVWTLHDWAKQQMARLLPMTMDDYQLPPEIEGLLDKLDQGKTVSPTISDAEMRSAA